MPRLTPLAVLFLLCLAPLQAAGQQVFNFGPGESSGSNFAFPDGSIVNVDGGTIGLGVDLTGGVLNIDSGEVALATNFTAGFTNSGNTVNLRGGEVGEFFQLFDSTTFNLSGGRIGSFGVFDGSVATITGGQVDRFPDVFPGGRAEIFGGDLFSVRAVGPGAVVNLHGSSFALDGAPIDLEIGQTLAIPQRGVQLTATLADGSPLEYDLSLSGDFGGPNPDLAAAGAVITVTRTAIPGDFNADGSVDAADYTVWRDAFGSAVATPFAGPDGDGDGLITLADFQVFLDNFGAVDAVPLLAAVSVPEPATACLLFFALTAGVLRRRA